MLRWPLARWNSYPNMILTRVCVHCSRYHSLPIEITIPERLWSSSFRVAVTPIPSGIHCQQRKADVSTGAEPTFHDAAL